MFSYALSRNVREGKNRREVNEERTMLVSAFRIFKYDPFQVTGVPVVNFKPAAVLIADWRRACLFLHKIKYISIIHLKFDFTCIFFFNKML